MNFLVLFPIFHPEPGLVTIEWRKTTLHIPVVVKVYCSWVHTTKQTELCTYVVWWWVTKVEYSPGGYPYPYRVPSHWKENLIPFWDKRFPLQLLQNSMRAWTLIFIFWLSTLIFKSDLNLVVHDFVVLHFFSTIRTTFEYSEFLVKGGDGRYGWRSRNCEVMALSELVIFERANLFVPLSDPDPSYEMVSNNPNTLGKWKPVWKCIYILTKSKDMFG